MKTIKDAADYMKRNACRLDLTSGKDGFTVSDGRFVKSSKYLDDALEGLAEDRRRADSGTTLRDRALNDLMRSTKPITAYVNMYSQPNTVTAACGTVTAYGGTCPKCNALPFALDSLFLYCSKCAQGWGFVGGATYALTNGRKWQWDLARNIWNQVP